MDSYEYHLILDLQSEFRETLARERRGAAIDAQHQPAKGR